MGKILDGLKIAQGELPERVLRSLDELEDGSSGPNFPLQSASPLYPSGDHVAVAETGMSDMPAEHAVPMPVRISEGSTGAPWPSIHTERLSLRVCNSAPLLSLNSEDQRAAEQYRIARTKILQHPSQPSVIVVSSPSIGDGKTVSAVNLAAALAMKSDEQILLMDADLRRPTVHARLHLPKAPGLAEVLAGTCRFQDAVVRIEQFPNLYVLTCGEPLGNAAELLDSPAWRALADSVRRLFRRVVVDSPPIEAVADYDLIAPVCDGVVLVVRPNHTNRTLCQRAVEKVRQKMIGVLLNGVDDWFLWKHYSPHYYYQYTQNTDRE